MYLNCKTYFSYRYGTFTPKQLVEAAVEIGATSLALTNINNTSDIWDFVALCNAANIKPIAGVEIRNEDMLCYVLIARNNLGLENINRFLSQHLISKEAFPLRPSFSDDVIIIYPFDKGFFSNLVPNEYIGVQITDINRLLCIDYKKYVQHLLVRHPVTFQNKTYYNLHRLLRAIDKNIILSKQIDTHKAAPHESFLSFSVLMDYFQQYPQILSNTFQLLDTCSIEMTFHLDKNKKYYTASKEDDKELLRKLAYDGLHYRYGTRNKTASERVEKELKIIDDLNFNAYFLINWDLLKYAKSRGFYYVGRGSGANSIIAYCLQITDVDPIELDLYFERFLNPYRKSPPDFDLDFSWADRDEMIDYIFKRYGRDHVALLGMFSTFQFKASIRELGKVFGLPTTEIEKLLVGDYNKADKNHLQIYQYAKLMNDFPNHLSIHPGGMLISEHPIYQYTAIDLPPKGFHTAQIDMFVAEEIGLYKFDILSQRGLGHIKDTIQMVKANKGIDIDIHNIEQFKKDKQVAANIRTGNTTGCFYIESPSMRQLLKKLRCDDYKTLVAASSIIRPGVGQSGMMQTYIYRFHHPDKFEHIHPKMGEILQDTFGVMVYQEDVIKVAHHFAGLDMAEADVLRRHMSGKTRGNEQMITLQKKFFSNCKERGYPDHIAAEVWRQMESFSGYSFCKAHSASFAVESYQSLYLKTYFPVEFMVAVINNFGGFYSRELYFQQLRKIGATVSAPSVNYSEYLTSILDDIVYVGFVHIQNLEKKIADIIITERQQGGIYLHLQDFIERTNIGMEQLNILIKVGALSFTGKTKKELLWEGNFLRKATTSITVGKSLFVEKPMSFSLPQLPQTPLEDRLQEMDILRFPQANAFEMVEADLSKYPLAKDIPALKGKEITCLAYLVCTKDTATKKDRRRMHFGTFIDAAGDWMDTVHFPNSAAMFPFKGRGFYEFSGIVTEEFGVFTIAVNTMKKVGIKKLN
ncbi:DNA polymerase III subunit alpha [Arachidicoccus soli]|uniref:DNA-directed DNA polymerase n=1 Tax=Arachidicoccus soli TaxID=2341117 RepID=A0A386HPF1_9BACT|nr:DNA polymerase III subunit alpha [Arachidicoccus soli]AYD47370.1 DNA polymerase III subunit alpha [Arachidicoccus soli]